MGTRKVQIQRWLTAAAMNIKRAVRTPTLLPAAVAAAHMALSKLSYRGPASQLALLRDIAISVYYP